jgi:hypothetical protein
MSCPLKNPWRCLTQHFLGCSCLLHHVQGLTLSLVLDCTDMFHSTASQILQVIGRLHSSSQPYLWMRQNHVCAEKDSWWIPICLMVCLGLLVESPHKPRHITHNFACSERQDSCQAAQQLLCTLNCCIILNSCHQSFKRHMPLLQTIIKVIKSRGFVCRVTSQCPNTAPNKMS